MIDNPHPADCHCIVKAADIDAEIRRLQTDLASAFDIDPEEAKQALVAALSANHEPLSRIEHVVPWKWWQRPRWAWMFAYRIRGWLA